MNTILKRASLEMATREGLVLSKRSQRSVDFTWFVGSGFWGLVMCPERRKGALAKKILRTQFALCSRLEVKARGYRKESYII